MRLLFAHVHQRLFCRADHPRHHLAPMDLGTSMGCASEAGHQVAFVETQTGETDLEGFLRRLDADPAKLVVLRPAFEAVEHMAEVVEVGRARGRTVLLAGTAAAHACKGLLRETGAAAVATGELDYTPVKLAEAMESGASLSTVPGIAWLDDGRLRRNKAPRLERKLDGLPMPRHDLLVRPQYCFNYPLRPGGPLKMGYMLASRGCPHACVFCSEVERVSFGRAHRVLSPARVAAEMEVLQALGVTGLYFEDDLFAVSKRRFLDVCAAIEAAATGISWCCQVRAGDVDDEVAEALARAGCASVACGIETASDRLLEAMRKATTIADVRRGTAALRRAGVDLVAYLMIGIPGETRAERMRTLHLADELHAAMAQLHIFSAYPGTAACSLYPELSIPGSTKFDPGRDRDDGEELLRLQRDFYRRYYLRPDRLLRHAWRRRAQLMASPRGEVQTAWQLVRHVLGV